MCIDDQGIVKIGVLDSGTGCLVVAPQLQRAIPRSQIVVLADTANGPYAGISPELIEERSKEALRTLLTLGVDVVVLACHATSVSALDALQKICPVPVVGLVEPSVRALLDGVRNKRLGLIATPGKDVSVAYQKYLKLQTEPGHEFAYMWSSLLVPLLEEGWKNHPVPVTQFTLSSNFGALRDVFEAEAVILGNPEFALIEAQFGELLGPDCRLILPHVEVARAVRALMPKLLRSGTERLGGQAVRYLVTDDQVGFEAKAKRMLGVDTEIRAELVSV